MTPIQMICYITFLIILLIREAHTDLITIGYSRQYANDQPLRKFVDQFGLSFKKDETQIFWTHKMEKWKDFLESHIEYAEVIPWLQEQTIINICKMCDGMNLAEFALLYDIVNTTNNGLIIIDSDSKSSDQINTLMRTSTKRNLSTHSTGKVSPIIYSSNSIVSNNWLHKLERTCYATIPSVPNHLRRRNTLYSFMPQIFASATEHKYHNRFYHSTQQTRAVHKAHQDSRSYHVLSKYRKKHHIYTKKYKLLKLHREQAKRKIRKQASDILKVPIGRRKLLCKYRKSCYNTSIIPDTWNIYNILPRFMDPREQKNFSEKEIITDIYTRNANEEKEEISEAELKLLCRYRKSCYEEMGAKIEKSALKVQSGPIFSRVITILPETKQKSTKEIARMALAKVEEKERTAALQPIPMKVIIDRDLNQIEEKMKKRLACKYRKSCYDSGVPPEIDVPFNNLFQKIYHFLRRRNQQAGVQEIIHKEFKDFNDNEKRVYCKYRKSCYNTAQKPVVNRSQIFKYTDTVKKYEELIPLKTRCKYRKSCYDTGILLDLKKKVAEETQPVVPVQIVTSLYHLKAFCKYRKSCYKQKAEEQQNLSVGLLNEAKTLEKDESEAIKSFQKEAILKSEKTEESNVSKKMGSEFEMKPMKETGSKKIIKKSKIFVPELEEKKMVAAIENEKFEETVHKSKKKKPKDPVEETPIEPPKKDQKIASSTIVKRSTTEKRALEYIGSKKERVKAEKIQVDKKITKEKKILVKKEFEKEPLPTAAEESLPVKELQSIFLQAENITSLKQVNIYDKSLSPLASKLLCKYRKSCYENGKLPPIETEKTILHDFQEKEDHRSLEIRCKYRKSCYETNKLPENLHENFKMRDLTKKEYMTEKHTPEEHIPLALRCKYRKSCYETGELPPIETNRFGFSTNQIFNEYKDTQSTEELSKEQLKLRCKYRKSCYESGILPPYLNHTVYVVTTSIKQHENPQLKCKYRRSCYESMELDIKLDKDRKKEEHKKVQEGTVKEPHQTESIIKHKEKKQKEEAQEEIMDEEGKRIRKKKNKESKSEAKEQEYMQIEPLDSQSRQTATTLRPLNSAQKLKCKYRLKCYDGVPLHQVAEEKRIEKQRHLSIKDFRRANGAICSIYYISCRKQAGLPIFERAPIGPNGRRLCRKKKKEETSS
ncbi:unnamed protein product [Cercopithifilaria johnstoni]|uniref:Uncharacterized protein n=1 Tax=Cercopithifilaria johnstoni TaxID=2874296 RepID=A0A8J2Q0F6_9BILA|nr:unnamed protein product [Cercopithifilaria johnstoni]